jgi:hypothetical protein
MFGSDTRQGNDRKRGWTGLDPDMSWSWREREDWNEWRCRVGSECGWDEQPLEGVLLSSSDGWDSELEVPV